MIGGLVYLDIDGVINTGAYYHCLPDNEQRQALANQEPERFQVIDITCFGILNRFCLDHPTWRLVCSSVWRSFDQEVIEQGLRKAHQRLQNALELDIEYGLQFLDTSETSWRTTLEDFDNKPRPEAIDEHRQQYGEYLPYMILDDEIWDFTPEQQRFWIQTNAFRGLTPYELVDMNILANKTWPEILQQRHDIDLA